MSISPGNRSYPNLIIRPLPTGGFWALFSCRSSWLSKTFIGVVGYTIPIENGDDRNRTTRKNKRKTGVSVQSGAECGALDSRRANFPPELAAVIEAWPKLPEAIRIGILAMIGAAE